MNDIVKELTAPIKPPTEEEHRKTMGKFFTVKHDRVERCGHKFKGVIEPDTGCPDCWAAYFYINGDITSTADECFQKEGRETLIKVKGKRFTKWFIRFMAEIQKHLKEVKPEAQPEIEENGREREVGSSQPSQ